MNSMYVSETHCTEIATDNAENNITCTVEQANLSKYLDDSIHNINELFQTSFRDAVQDIEQTINAHPFYIMYEPKLGCSANQDTSVSRSVYPIFKADLGDIMSSLECKVTKQIIPIINSLICQREEIINKTFNQNAQMAVNASEEANSLRKQVEYLHAALLDERKFKNDQIDALKREIQMLREELMQKNKIGQIYKPDFIDKNGQDGEHMVTQKYLKEQLLEQEARFEEDKKMLEKKYEGQINSLMQEISDLLGEIEELKAEIARLNAIIEQQNKDFNDLNENIGQKYQQEIDNLNKELEGMMKRMEAEQDDYEKELREKNELIRELEEKLKKLYALLETNEDAINKLREDLLREQDANRNLLLTNQQLQDLSKQSPGLADEVKALNDELTAMRNKYDMASRRLEELEELKKALEDELKRLRGEYNGKGGLDPDMEKLLKDAELEFNNMRELVARTVRSLFNKESGSFVRLMQDELYNMSPYDILRRDVGEDLWIYVNKYYKPEYDMIQQFCANYANNNFRTRARGKNEMLKEVNAVILDDVQTTSRRIPSAGKKNFSDIGINTSLCGSLENEKLDDAFAVNQSLNMTEEELSQYSNVNVQTSNRSRPHSSLGGTTSGRASAMGNYQVESGMPAPEVRCPSCNRSGELSEIEIFGTNGDVIADIKTEVNCGNCGDEPGGMVQCSACSREAPIGNVRVSSRMSDNRSAVEDSAVEYLYKEDELLIEDLSRQPGAREEQGVEDHECAAKSKGDENDGDAKGVRSVYVCPFCKKCQSLSRVRLTPIDEECEPAVDAGQATFIYNNEKYLIPEYRFGFKSRGSTVPDTLGVFDRLFARAREIELARKRKRDLLLQERMRTTERVLRALSLFVDRNEDLSKSAYEIQSGQRLVSMRSGRLEVTTPSTRHSSAYGGERTYLQAVMEVNDIETTTYRPGSAITNRENSARTATFQKTRPQSGREQSVMQLLATSNMFANGQK